MDKKDIIEIIDLFSDKKLNKLLIKKGDFLLEVEKGSQVSKSQDKIIDRNREIEEIEKVEEAVEREEESIEEVKGYEVKSPLVGIYYEAASPESEAFVNIGDYVEKDQIICIIEAMKMINEIKAPVSGTICKINFENEDLVQYDDVIMEIEENV